MIRATVARPSSRDHLILCPLAFGFAGGGNNMKKGELRAAIVRGYREMSELTKVKCGGDKCPGVGNRAYRCCDRMHRRRAEGATLAELAAATAWGKARFHGSNEKQRRVSFKI